MRLWGDSDLDKWPDAAGEGSAGASTAGRGTLARVGAGPRPGTRASTAGVRTQRVLVTVTYPGRANRTDQPSCRTLTLAGPKPLLAPTVTFKLAVVKLVVKADEAN